MAWGLTGNLRPAVLDVPSYAPSPLAHAWEPRNSGYNWNQGTLNPARAALAKLIAGQSDMHALFVGDSTLIGYNGASYFSDQAIPRQFGKALAKFAGDLPFTDGVRSPVMANGVASELYALTGGFAADQNYIMCTSTGTATWTSLDIGTAFEMYVANTSVTGFTWTIDGVSQTAVTTDGTTTLKKVTVTGLSNKAHTVVINGVTGGSNFVIIFGQRVYNPNIKQLHVHNLAIGGTFANNGANYLNWNSTSSSSPPGMGWVAPAIMTAMGITPDIVFCSLGNNDAHSSVTAANIGTGLSNLRAYSPWASSPFVLIHPPKVTGTDATLFGQVGTEFFTLADSLGVAYFDWNDFEGTLTGYTANGMAGADGIHPTQADQLKIGRHLAYMLGDQPSAQLAGATRLIEVSGSYPPRPNVPAGQVTYTGADQPGDWLPGDAWDDLP